MDLVYLDSSVALRTILDVPERERLQSWMQVPGPTFVSSRLLRTEMIRVLRREGRPLVDGRPLLERVGMTSRPFSCSVNGSAHDDVAAELVGLPRELGGECGFRPGE